MPIIDASAASETQGRPNIKGRAIIRIIDAKYRKSAAGNSCLNLTYEIAAPENMQTPNGKTVKAAGLKGFEGMAFSPNNNFSLTKLKLYCNGHKISPKIDIENAAQLKQFIGKAYAVMLGTKSNVLKDSQGNPEVDENGQPICEKELTVLRIIGGDTEHTIPADSIAY